MTETTGSSYAWQGDRAARWAARWEALDRQLQPVTEHLLAAAAARPGERVLDVGCGTGPTTRLAAEAVGAGGSVVGLDVAVEMLDVARTVPVAAGAAPTEWVQADATTWGGAGEPFDLVLSRFGVMFFDDPDPAFTNLRRLTSPEGRLCIATWQEREASTLFELPLAVLVSQCRAWGLEPELPPGDSGPFSLHEQAVRALLDRTGWRDVTTSTHTLSLSAGGGAGTADAAAVALDTGPTRTVAETLTDDQRARAQAAMAEALADHLDAEGHVRLDGAVVITTARP